MTPGFGREVAISCGVDREVAVLCGVDREVAVLCDFCREIRTKLPPRGGTVDAPIWFGVSRYKPELMDAGEEICQVNPWY